MVPICETHFQKDSCRIPLLTLVDILTSKRQGLNKAGTGIPDNTLFTNVSSEQTNLLYWMETNDFLLVCIVVTSTEFE